MGKSNIGQSRIAASFAYLDTSKQGKIDVGMFERGINLLYEQDFDFGRAYDADDLSSSRATIRMGKHKTVVKPEASDPLELWTLIEKVGEGSYGEIYKAISRSSPQIVALKIIDLERTTDDLDDLLAEVDFQAKCFSPHLARYFGSWMWEHKLTIAMEYLGGGTAEDLIKHGKLTEDQCAYILREVVKGLEYMHSERKIHRDVKAANILFDNAGAVKLADFGVAAQLAANKAVRTTFVGTPLYMAPEIVLSQPYGPKVDIWSLGIMAIELGTRRAPRCEMHPMDVLYSIPTTPSPQLDESFSSEFRDFVKQCLAKNPEARPTAKDLLSHPFTSTERDKSSVKGMIESIRLKKNDAAAEGDKKAAVTCVRFGANNAHLIDAKQAAEARKAAAKPAVLVGSTASAEARSSIRPDLAKIDIRQTFGRRQARTAGAGAAAGPIMRKMASSGEVLGQGRGGPPRRAGMEGARAGRQESAPLLSPPQVAPQQPPLQQERVGGVNVQARAAQVASGLGTTVAGTPPAGSPMEGGGLRGGGGRGPVAGVKKEGTTAAPARVGTPPPGGAPGGGQAMAKPVAQQGAARPPGIATGGLQPPQQPVAARAPSPVSTITANMVSPRGSPATSSPVATPVSRPTSAQMRPSLGALPPPSVPIFVPTAEPAPEPNRLRPSGTYAPHVVQAPADPSKRPQSRPVSGQQQLPKPVQQQAPVSDTNLRPAPAPMVRRQSSDIEQNLHAQPRRPSATSATGSSAPSPTQPNPLDPASIPRSTSQPKRLSISESSDEGTTDLSLKLNLAIARQAHQLKVSTGGGAAQTVSRPPSSIPANYHPSEPFSKLLPADMPLSILPRFNSIKAVDDLYTSELRYMETLQSVMEVYVRPLITAAGGGTKGGPILKEDQIKAVFVNLSALHPFSVEMQGAIREAIEEGIAEGNVDGRIIRALEEKVE
ncbi:Serine/threonine-protein kinase 24 [Borealophlyctis nickersoniae]|nr:Serine/threonine-protein kinase 24 [Borealophlyctis nickersoniae]